MCWHFNPASPNGAPIQPGPADPLGDPETNSNRGSGFDQTNLYTRGRCGACAAVPPVWKLTLPVIPLNPYSAQYSGLVYLRRIPYEDNGAFTGFWQDKCSWGQIADEPISGANKYRGPFADGWHLTFEFNAELNAFSWSIYTPAEYGDLEFEANAQTRYLRNGQFLCLEANAFDVADIVATYEFPYRPPVISIIPFYA